MTTSSECPSGQAQLTRMTFNTRSPISEGSTGFAIVNENGSPTTEATISDFVFSVAFPAGMVGSMSLDEGNYSGPAQSSTTINGASFDVFTFTYQGDKTQSTIDAGGDPWEDSEISTTIVPKTDACVPMRGGVTYYTQCTGSWTTANGTSGSIPAGWIPTRMARQDVS